MVNPHQQDCGYPYKELCGAGVAWNVIRVLYENYDMDKREAEDLLDFVAMATVCDVMSLTGENRILVKEGLKRIRHTKNIGLQALMQACNVQPENISAYHFGYVLGPCVNATGRLDTARHALRLFETGQETEAEEIARDLVDLNQERKDNIAMAAVVDCARPDWPGVTAESIANQLRTAGPALDRMHRTLLTLPPRRR